MQAIAFEKVTFSYQDADEQKQALTDPFSCADSGVFALRNVDFCVEEGEFVAVLGHNGSGKSTLARLTNGLLSVTSGKITVMGLDATDERNLFDIRKQVGIVFQNPDNQMVASIVEDDVAFGPENIGVEREEIGERITFALDAVGMSEYRHGTPNRLSGGQKQRIAIAGALALKPKILILDESTAMLDPRGRKEVLDVVLKLNKQEKMTVLLITHFPEEAMLADRAIVMNRGEIVMQGKPQEILCREAELEKYHLALPLPVQICRALTKGGLGVEDTLDFETLANDLLEKLPKGKWVKNTQDTGVGTRSIDQTLQSGRVDCQRLSHTYNANSPFATHALSGVDLQIDSGDFFGIIGHTGSGKSTFVQYLNALLKLPTAEKKYKQKKKDIGKVGTVLQVNGFDLTDKKTDFKALRKKVGMVFQYPEYQLFAETVFADVAFGLKNFATEELTSAQIRQAVKEAIQTVGLNYDEIKNRSPFELSGGQKRRVAIAGVIVTKPEILVLDEPAAGLDPLGKQEIMQLLHNIHQQWCKTVIIVSHDMDEISQNCNKAAVFSEGKIVAVGEPKTLFESGETQKAGLDVPFTQKVLQRLSTLGIDIDCDLTSEDFVQQALQYAQSAGVCSNRSEGGNEHD